MFQAGFINIYGKPNVGKSTLFNKLLKEKLSIVSHKAQTTRKSFKGIVSSDQYQIVFVDTPGFIKLPRYELHRLMMNEIEQSRKGVDGAILLIDAKETFEEVQLLLQSFQFPQPLLLVINKTDTILASELQEKINTLKEIKNFTDVISICAIENKNIDKLIQAVLKFLPSSEPYYDSEELTDKSTRFIVAEFIREEIFHLFEQEIPYETSVVVQAYEEQALLVKIRADIIVQREQQKIIIIGEKGAKIKQVGIQARQQIEKLIDRKVYLELFVKVRNNWRDIPVYLKEFGY